MYPNVEIEVRSWLVELMEWAKTRPARDIYKRISEEEIPNPDDDCDCKADSLKNPAWLWLHENHDLYALLVLSEIQGYSRALLLAIIGMAEEAGREDIKNLAERTWRGSSKTA